MWPTDHCLNLTSEYAFAKVDEGNYGLMYWLAKLRTQIVEDLAKEYIEKNNINRESVTHIKQLFFYHAKAKGWNTLNECNTYKGFYPMPARDLTKFDDQFKQRYAEGAVFYVAQRLKSDFERMIEKFSNKNNFPYDMSRYIYFNQAKKGLLRTMGLKNISSRSLFTVDSETCMLLFNPNFINSLIGIVFYGFCELKLLSGAPIVIEENENTVVKGFKQSILNTVWVREEQQMNGDVVFTNAKECYENKIFWDGRLVDKEIYIEESVSSGKSYEILTELEHYPDPKLEAALIDALAALPRQDGHILTLAALRLSEEAWHSAGYMKLRRNALAASLLRGELTDYLMADPTNLHRIKLVQETFSRLPQEAWRKVQSQGELKLLTSFMNILIGLKDNPSILMNNFCAVAYVNLLDGVAIKNPQVWVQSLEKGDYKHVTPLSIVTWLLIKNPDDEDLDDLMQMIIERLADETWANVFEKRFPLAQLIHALKENLNRPALINVTEKALLHAPKEIWDEVVKVENFDGCFGQKFIAILSKKDKSLSALGKQPSLKKRLLNIINSKAGKNHDSWLFTIWEEGKTKKINEAEYLQNGNDSSYLYH